MYENEIVIDLVNLVEKHSFQFVLIGLAYGLLIWLVILVCIDSTECE